MVGGGGGAAGVGGEQRVRVRETFSIFTSPTLSLCKRVCVRDIFVINVLFFFFCFALVFFCEL